MRAALLPLAFAATSSTPAAGEAWAEQLAARALCPSPWLGAASTEAATERVLRGLGARGLPTTAQASVQRLLAGVAPSYTALFRQSMPSFVYNATQGAANVERWAGRAFASSGSSVPGLTHDEATAVACWSLECFIAVNVCLRAGFPFGMRSAAEGQDGHARPLREWAGPHCEDTTRLIGWLFGGLRKLGARGSPYALGNATALARCLQHHDPQPGQFLYADRGFLSTVLSTECDRTEHGPLEVAFRLRGGAADALLGAAQLGPFGASPSEVLLPPGQLYTVSEPSGSANYSVSGCGMLTNRSCAPRSASERDAALAQIGPVEPTDCTAFRWPARKSDDRGLPAAHQAADGADPALPSPSSALVPWAQPWGTVGPPPEPDRKLLMAAHRLSVLRRRLEQSLGAAGGAGGSAGSRHWWGQDEAVRETLRQLDHHGFVTIDSFQGQEEAAALRRQVQDAREAGALSAAGMLRGAANRSTKDSQRKTGGRGVKAGFIRGDEIGWFNIGQRAASEPLSRYVRLVDDFVTTLREADDGSGGLKGVRRRSDAMVTCYPEGAKYVRHTDNSCTHGAGARCNGRRLTAIGYLNPPADDDTAGALRIFHPGPLTSAARVDVQPLLDRLVLFYANERTPHAVLPAEKPRFAVTIWYYDELEAAELQTNLTMLP